VKSHFVKIRDRSPRNGTRTNMAWNTYVSKKPFCRPSTTSSTPRWSGSTCTTTAARAPCSTTSHPRNTRAPTTLNSGPPGLRASGPPGLRAGDVAKMQPASNPGRFSAATVRAPTYAHRCRYSETRCILQCVQAQRCAAGARGSAAPSRSQVQDRGGWGMRGPHKGR
jgi:hypothetical protein